MLHFRGAGQFVLLTTVTGLHVLYSYITRILIIVIMKFKAKGLVVLLFSKIIDVSVSLNIQS